MAVEELTLNPGLSCVSFLVTSPSRPSVQAASVALADTGLIPVTPPVVIDMGKAHTYLATNVAHTPCHQDQLTAPRLVLWKSSHGLQAIWLLGDCSEAQRF